MARSKFVLAPALACSALFLTGELSQPPRKASAAVEATFVSRPLIPRHLAHQTPESLLARAVAALDPQRVPWLVVKSWQKQVAEEMSFEADGRLVRGPNHCARLDLTVRGSGEPSAVVVVSDGTCLAQACRLAGRHAEVSSQPFLSPAQTPLSGLQIEQILDAHGCGGPRRLLKELAAKLEALQMDSGVWQGRNVIRLTGSLKAVNPSPNESRQDAQPRRCRIYLDAQTLWPHRVEWWTARGPSGSGCPFLQVEYREPRINQPLSRDECVREFTYVPD